MTNLKKARLSKGFSQKELAITLKVAQPTVSAWESGRKHPTGENLNKICKILDVSADYLLGNINDPSLQRKKTSPELTTEEALLIAIKKMLGREPTEEESRKFLDMAKVFFDVKD